MSVSKLEFNAQGMHCAACENFIESQIKKHKGVKKVDAKLSKGTVTVEIDTMESSEKLADEFTELVKENGYKITTERHNKDWKKELKELGIASLIAFVLIILYLSLENLGFLPKAGGDFELNYISSFALGIVASLSTCSAVLGGIILSLSTNTAKVSRKAAIAAGITFHFSRIISFLVLGAGLGLLGQAFAQSGNFDRLEFTFWTNLVLGLVMLVLGVNLLGLLNLNKFQFKMPKGFGKTIINFSENSAGIFAGFGLGLLSFFLPCNFTQAIQLQALASGSPVDGGILLFAFALGTMPVLGLLTFASVNFTKSIRSGIFYKTSGLLIIALALFTIYSSLYLKGVVIG